MSVREPERLTPSEERSVAAISTLIAATGLGSWLVWLSWLPWYAAIGAALLCGLASLPGWVLIWGMFVALDRILSGPRVPKEDP